MRAPSPHSLQQQVAALAGLHRRCRRQHALEVAELADQLRRALRPDPRHPRHVVDAVADQRLRVDQLVRQHAELFHHLGDADRLLLDRVEHLDARPDQLHQVLVGRNDGRGAAHADRAFGVGRDQVVGLPVGQLDRRHAERLGRLAHQRELRDQFGRRVRPLRLVLFVEAIAESQPPGVENDREMGADMLLQQPRQHVGEAEHRVHRRAVRPRHRRQRVEGAEDEARSVDQDQVQGAVRRNLAP